METLYDVLGARPDADAESLKRAYHAAAKANHPDRHAFDPEAALRFKRIVTAYDILRDTRRRAAYDRLLESQRWPLPSQARRATSHPAYQFAFTAITGVIVGIVLAGGGYLVRIYGIAGDAAGGMAAGERMVVVEPAKQADAASGEAPGHRPESAPRIPVTQGAAAAVEGKGTWEAAQGLSAPDAAGRSAHLTDPTAPKAPAGDPGRAHGAEPAEQPQSTEPKTAATSQDEICKRDAAQLAHLRMSQGRDEVIRFERELGCEKLRLQVLRLRESVDFQ
jgi:curved DNA-binding protein CbpA